MNFDENTFARMIERAGGDDALRPQHQAQLRKRVLEVFDRAQTDADRPTFPARSLTNCRWIMRHPVSRVAAAAIFVLAVTGVALWFHGGGTKPAFADFLQPILDAKSVKYRVTYETEGQPTMTAVGMMLGPDRMRWETEVLGKSREVKIWDLHMGKQVTLHPAEQRALVLDITNMLKEKRPPMSFFDEIRSQLLDVRDKPGVKREPLGEKDIDGHRAVGYRISGFVFGITDNAFSLWGDPKTGLPIRIEQTNLRFPNSKTTMSDFLFNGDLDESLFSIEPPAGYTIESGHVR